MEMSLAGKVALVTGGSRGIGKAIARAFAEAGAQVMISSRKAEDLEATAAELGERVAWHAANAGDPGAAEECVSMTVERLGGLDILVNNAATNPYMGPVIDSDIPRWDKTFQVNLRGPLNWSQAAWKARMADSGGAIINISSIGGLKPGGPIGVYDTTKAALVHLTSHLATEMAPGVRVNAIAPGLVKTDFARVLVEGVGDAVAARTPLRRLGEPEDIASAALFLASDASSWITGQTLVVDGGALLSGAMG
jgi:NAD(P)-dependent dehydrogenase (short-subunit alcohol dehydrogenase family)